MLLSLLPLVPRAAVLSPALGEFAFVADAIAGGGLVVAVDDVVGVCPVFSVAVNTVLVVMVVVL